MEYFQHLLDVLSRAERSAGERLGPAAGQPTAAAFGFQVEDRVQCSETGRVSYRRTPQNVMALDIDLEAAVNKEELEEYKVWLTPLPSLIYISGALQGAHQKDNMCTCTHVGS